MTKFLIKASYTADGVKGVLKTGGTSRKQAVDKMLTEMGGKLESFYFALGEHDAYIVVELPDAVSAAALAMTINATGLVSTSTTRLLDPTEVDKATKLLVNYRAPGT